MTKGQAERLFPMIEASLARAKREFSDLDAIAVATGPGNFTGIRIAVSAARGLAMSLRIPTIGVSVLEALAYGKEGRVLTIVDARGGRLYGQSFKADTPLGEPVLTTPDALPEQFESIDTCSGFDAPAIANAVGAPNAIEGYPAVETYGLIAMQRDWSRTQPPAPLYLRPPDAALPSEPPPRIIP